MKTPTGKRLTRKHASPADGQSLSVRSEKFDFESLVAAITQISDNFLNQAAKAVNVSLTLRNWLIGCYIREYELGGSDRAAYGEQLLERLAKRLEAQGARRTDQRELRRYRQFYLTYPQIREALSPEFITALPAPLRAEKKIRDSLAPELALTGPALLDRLSFSHLTELIQIDEPLKRAFYEIECTKSNWSVRELKRQIASLYYERSDLSKDKKRLSKIVGSKAEIASAAHVIRDPYVFEFLGIKPKEVMHESDLEESLLDKLQEFLLELGRGFCFESRQKRMLIGDAHFFVDLVFYHRILKCHVLIELKVDDFSHESLGQLNTYVNWFRANEMTKGDSPPIGILLCTKRSRALVEYALAGMDNHLFVSKYQLELPKKDEMRRFLEEQIGEEDLK